jgi:cytochrome c biogenesis protein CcdA
MTSSSRRSRLANGASAIAVVLLSVLTSAQTGRPSRAELTPLVESAQVQAGSTTRIALRVQLGPGLHAQSNHPRDPSLKPAVLTIDAPPGVTDVEHVFPAATDLKLPGFDEPAAVFEHEFVIGAQLKIAADHPTGPLEIPGRLQYQACNDTMCFAPVTVETRWSLEVVPATTPVVEAHTDVFRAIAFGHGEPPPAPIKSPAPVAPTSRPGSATDLARLDRFAILGRWDGYGTSSQFLEFIHNAETGVTAKGPFEGQGPFAILAIVFLGGLALNLTPCVLPMIPINLAIIGAGARSQAGRSRGFFLGAAYGAAMAIVYGVLGLVVIRTAGTFGTINASPWFNVGIAVLFVLLGLAMFDVLSLDFSRWSSRIRFDQTSRGTLYLAFSMGAVAALLAGACVAPVVVQVVVFASNLYAAGTPSALALPFVLGLGMAVPWPIAGAGLAALPKPGAWMVRVKQVMGVFILATAAYYGYVAYGIFANRWVDPATVRASVDAQLKEGWHPSLAEGLALAQQNNTPVLIDFWATWCKNCLTMDETTLKDEAVKSALRGYTLVKYQAEDPDEPAAKAILERVGSKGLPTYVILKPKP